MKRKIRFIILLMIMCVCFNINEVKAVCRVMGHVWNSKIINVDEEGNLLTGSKFIMHDLNKETTIPYNEELDGIHILQDADEEGIINYTPKSIRDGLNLINNRDTFENILSIDGIHDMDIICCSIYCSYESSIPFVIEQIVNPQGYAGTNRFVTFVAIEFQLYGSQSGFDSKSINTLSTRDSIYYKYDDNYDYSKFGKMTDFEYSLYELKYRVGSVVDTESKANVISNINSMDDARSIEGVSCPDEYNCYVTYTVPYIAYFDNHKYLQIYEYEYGFYSDDSGIVYKEGEHNVYHSHQYRQNSLYEYDENFDYSRLDKFTDDEWNDFDNQYKTNLYASEVDNNLIITNHLGSSDLSINISVNDDKEITANAGEKLNYKVLVKNNGNIKSLDNKVTVLLPDGIEYVEGSASENGVYDKDKHTITWNMDNIDPDEAIELIFEAVATNKNVNYIVKASVINSDMEDNIDSNEVSVTISKVNGDNISDNPIAVFVDNTLKNSSLIIILVSSLLVIAGVVALVTQKIKASKQKKKLSK